MKTPIRVLGAALLALVCALPLASQANVIISGTRVVFPAQDGEVTVRLTNDNATPALIQAWVDAGDEHSTASSANTPFVLTPPLFRMDAHKDQSLRIMAGPDMHLPADRESLFWLNVLEIPPKPTSLENPSAQNMLQLALRSRLKMFYRPANLQGDPNKAAAAITWKAVKDAQGIALELTNPTPYHVTISGFSLQVAGKSYVNEAADMVAPMSTLRMRVKDLAQLPAANTALSFDAINDYGASSAFKGSVSP